MMKFFDIFKKTESAHTDEQSKALYSQLTSPAYQIIYRVEDIGEGMSLAEEIIMQYWKPRFLIDNMAKRAYEFMNVNEILRTITTDDIDWNSLEGLSEKAIERARDLDAHFPTLVRKYENGVAQVSWQLNPDGMYYRDEDGFGMTEDEEIEIYGFIDRQGRVVVKFMHINENWKRLEAMKMEAQTKVL